MPIFAYLCILSYLFACLLWWVLVPKNPGSCDDTVSQRLILLSMQILQHRHMRNICGPQNLQVMIGNFRFWKRKPYKNLMGNGAVIFFFLKESHMLLLVIHCAWFLVLLLIKRIFNQYHELQKTKKYIK